MIQLGEAYVHSISVYLDWVRVDRLISGTFQNVPSLDVELGTVTGARYDIVLKVPV